MSSEAANAPKSVQEEQNVNHFHCKKCKTFFKSKADQEEHVLLVHDKEKKTSNVIFVKSHLGMKTISEDMLKLFMETLKISRVICVKKHFFTTAD